jgi:amidase
MSIPLTWSADGLPLGSLIFGRDADEATLFRLAGQLEAARPWAERRPPIRAGSDPASWPAVEVRSRG